MDAKMLDELRKPFHPSNITWKPGAVKGNRALALAYADLRAYMNRLDDVCGDEWSVNYEPWGNDRIICRLTIGGVTRSSTGESSAEAERSEIGGTVAEAQAFKRAAAMFGLGRYLYNLPSGWEDYDPATKKFTDKAKAKLTGMLVQHFRRATEGATEMADVYSKTPASPANASQGAPVDSGDVVEPPTDDENDVLAMWQTPQDAYTWAVNVGACKHIEHARNSMELVVKEYGGKLTASNKAAVFLRFLRHQNAKLSNGEVVFG